MCDIMDGKVEKGEKVPRVHGFLYLLEKNRQELEEIFFGELQKTLDTLDAFTSPHFSTHTSSSARVPSARRRTHMTPPPPAPRPVRAATCLKSRFPLITREGSLYCTLWLRQSLSQRTRRLQTTSREIFGSQPRRLLQRKLMKNPMMKIQTQLERDVFPMAKGGAYGLVFPLCFPTQPKEQTPAPSAKIQSRATKDCQCEPLPFETMRESRWQSVKQKLKWRRLNGK